MINNQLTIFDGLLVYSMIKHIPEKLTRFSIVRNVMNVRLYFVFRSFINKSRYFFAYYFSMIWACHRNYMSDITNL